MLIIVTLYYDVKFMYVYQKEIERERERERERKREREKPNMPSTHTLYMYVLVHDPNCCTRVQMSRTLSYVIVMITCVSCCLAQAVVLLYICYSTSSVGLRMWSSVVATVVCLVYTVISSEWVWCVCVCNLLFFSTLVEKLGLSVSTKVEKKRRF